MEANRHSTSIYIVTMMHAWIEAALLALDMEQYFVQFDCVKKGALMIHLGLKSAIHSHCLFFHASLYWLAVVLPAANGLIAFFC